MKWFVFVGVCVAMLIFGVGVGYLLAVYNIVGFPQSYSFNAVGVP